MFQEDYKMIRRETSGPLSYRESESKYLRETSFSLQFDYCTKSLFPEKNVQRLHL